MRRHLIAVTSAATLLAGVTAPVTAVVDDDQPAATPVTDTPVGDERFETESESGRWIVRLDEAPLASYRGDIEGLAATSPEVTGAEQVDADAPASTAYLDHLADRQDQIIAEIEEALGRDVEVTHEYRAAFNGMAIEVSADEAAVVSDIADVAEVVPDEVHQLDTDVSNDLISSPAIWSGETSTGVGTRGEGVIVAMIDSGVNPEHPSFAATDGDGYAHTNPFGAGTYVGVCDPAHPDHEPICNDKLIGAWDYTGSSAGARDENGHGSHTGSTMAGNKHDAVVTVGDDEYVRTISGVAPRANVISYKVCGLIGCFSSDSVAAVDQAILDGVDVLNYSISGGDRPWTDSVDLAFLEAFEAGIFVAASAGNDGPGEGTVAKTAPWNATVAATTHKRVIANVLDVTGPDPVPGALTGIVAVPGDGTPFTESVEAPIRFSGPADAENQGCEPFEAGTFDGTIALIQRGGCNFSVKIDNASDAGAVGVVVFNQFAGPPVVMGEVGSTTVPGVMISNDDGVALRDHILAAETAVTARMGLESTLVLNENWEDIVTDFSSRGPSEFDLLNPTFAAPGRNILAATAAVGDDAVRYEVMQGTSMSSPHGAGAGALLTALHPDWTPAQIRSALAVSAHREGLVKEDGTTPADPFDVGSGRLDLAQASRVGLVLDETHENFVAANPATGGDPKTLNLPSMTNQRCDESCTWTRDVTSVADVPVTYTAVVDAPADATITVTPATFTIEPGQTQAIEITMDTSAVALGGDWMFGAVDLTTDATHGDGGPEVTDVHLPIAVIQPEASISVDPAALESLQDVAQQVPQAVVLTNSGGKALEWEVVGGAECELPSWASVNPASGTVGPEDSAQIEVMFDSTGMSAGDYTGTVCLATNDPHTPTATIDLALTVVEIPVVDVADGSVAKVQPAGAVTGDTFSISNDGWGTLNWTLDDPDAGPSEERVQMLRDGVLLAPNSARDDRGVMAFDPETGALLDPMFVPIPNWDPDETLYTPVHVVPKLDGTGFLVLDQVQSRITEYDLQGQFRGVFAPVGGAEDPTIMGNTRSMTWTPWDTLLVTVASQDNANSVVEFDADGNYLGQFVPAGLDGLDSPWDILIRDEDILVAASDSDAIHSFSLDGKTANPRFTEAITWPEQLVELDNGNVLTVNWGGGTGSAVHEYDSEGTEVGRYVATGSSYTGVHPLGNGNIIVSTSSGAYEIDRAGTVLETEYAGSRVRYFTEVRMPDAQTCSTPDEIPWVTVSASSGAVASGTADEVTVTLDSTGLAAGDYRAQLCVTSDDPDMPLVTIPVEMTVTDAVCTDAVTDAHVGALRADSGVLCLGYGSSVSGPVDVSTGASVFADGSTINGPVAVTQADRVQIVGSVVNGPVRISGTSGLLSLVGNYVRGPVHLARNSTGETPIVVSGNHIDGSLACSANSPVPVNDGLPNEVNGRASGQCGDV